MQENVLDDHFSETEAYPNANDYDPNLHGLRGWLAFLGFSLIISFLTTAVYNGKNYYTLIPNFSQLQDSLKIGIIFEICLIVVLVVLQAVCIYYYFNKKKKFPKLFIIYLGYYTLVDILDNFVIVQMIGSEPNAVPIFRGLTYSVIWFLYIRNSKRVKHTFLF